MRGPFKGADLSWKALLFPSAALPPFGLPCRSDGRGPSSLMVHEETLRTDATCKDRRAETEPPSLTNHVAPWCLALDFLDKSK